MYLRQRYAGRTPACIPLLHEDPSDVQRRRVVPTPLKSLNRPPGRKPVNTLPHHRTVSTRVLSHATRLNHESGAVKRGVSPLLGQMFFPKEKREVRLAAADTASW